MFLALGFPGSGFTNNQTQMQCTLYPRNDVKHEETPLLRALKGTKLRPDSGLRPGLQFIV